MRYVVCMNDYPAKGFKFITQKHKTTFGEPLGVPVIKPTQILNQLGRTGLYPGKPKKKKKKKKKRNCV